MTQCEQQTTVSESMQRERAYGYPAIDRGLGDDLAAFSFDSSLLLLALVAPLIVACFLPYRPVRGLARGLAS